MRADIFFDIDAERKYQEEKWGSEYDDTHTPADWWTFVTFYYARALQSWKIDKNNPSYYSKLTLRQGLIKVAAIIVAWIESLDRTMNTTTQEMR